MLPHASRLKDVNRPVGCMYGTLISSTASVNPPRFVVTPKTFRWLPFPPGGSAASVWASEPVCSCLVVRDFCDGAKTPGIKKLPTSQCLQWRVNVARTGLFCVFVYSLHDVLLMKLSGRLLLGSPILWWRHWCSSASFRMQYHCNRHDVLSNRIVSGFKVGLLYFIKFYLFASDTYCAVFQFPRPFQAKECLVCLCVCYH